MQIYHYNNYNGGISEFELFEVLGKATRRELEAAANVSACGGAGQVEPGCRQSGHRGTGAEPADQHA